MIDGGAKQIAPGLWAEELSGPVEFPQISMPASGWTMDTIRELRAACGLYDAEMRKAPRGKDSSGCGMKVV